MNRALMLIALLLAPCCSTPTRDAAPVDTGLIVLDDQDSQLARAFNAHADDAQLVMLLSPT